MNLFHAFTTEVYPLAILLAVLSGIAILLTIPPLIWHSKHHNFAPSFLISCILLTNIFNLTNATIWHNDHLSTWFSGAGLCDIHVKLTMGLSTALPCATLCILKKLANVMDTDNLTLSPSRSQRRRAALVEGLLCLLTPCATMIAHYLVQPTRYAIGGIEGCLPSLYDTWASVFLIILPPAVLALVNVYFAVLILVRLSRHRTTLGSLLTASSTSKARFLRLYALALVFVLGVFPVQIYLLLKNWPRNPQPYDWGKIHDKEAWVHIVLIPSLGLVGVDKWTQVASGFVVFFLFGVGREARQMYGDWIKAVGLRGVLDACARGGEKVRGALAWMVGRMGVKGRRGDEGRGDGTKRFRGRLLSSFTFSSFTSGRSRKGSKAGMTIDERSRASSAETEVDLEMQHVGLHESVTASSAETETGLVHKPDAVVSVVPVAMECKGGWSKVGRMSVPRWAGVFKGQVKGSDVESEK
ncbi:Pheromone A receptor-like protein [Elsinoe fawcettii]|nr:Pheromone A receptor-like protein [Elsinoe fawcettii]